MHTKTLLGIAGLAVAAANGHAQATNSSREYTVVEGQAPKDPTNTLPLRTTRIARFTVDEGSWCDATPEPSVSAPPTRAGTR